MANYWKKDPKTGKWVQDEEVTQISKKNTPKVSTSAPATKSLEQDISERENYVQNRSATLAAQDIPNAFTAAKTADAYAANHIYQPGGTNALRSDRGLYAYKQLNQQLPQYIKGLQSGTPVGMTEEDELKLKQATSDLWNYTQTQEKLLTARTGGIDTIDMSGMPKAQQQELGRMDTLYGFDMAPGKLGEAVPEDSSVKRTGVDTYQDLHSKQQAYSKKQLKNDLKVLDARYNAMYANPGMQFDAKSNAKFDEAAARVSEYFGTDMSTMPKDFGRDWSKGLLDKYDADTESLRGVVDDYDDYVEYDQAHARKAEQEEMAAAKGLQFKGEASALEAASKNIEGYEDKSKYIPSEAYWHPSHADFNILTGNSMPEEGDYTSWEDRSERVTYSFLNDYIGTSEALAKNPNDAAAQKKLAEMDAVAANIPSLRRYDLRSLPYMDDAQRETFYRYYRNGDFAAADEYLGKINYDIAKKAFDAWETAHEADLADNTFGENVLNWVTDIPLNVLAGWSNMAQMGNQWLDYLGVNLNQDYNHEYNEAWMTGKKVDMERGALGQQIANATPALTIPENIPIIGGKNAANLGYQALTSIADLVASRNIGGNAFTSWTMFGREGGDTMREAMIQGNPNAVLYGTAAGAWAALVEYFGGDELAANSFLKAANGEGLEEVVTGAGQTLLDLIINGKNSKLMRTYDEYVRKGYGENAKWATAEDTASDYVEQYAVGFGAGGAPAAVNSTIQHFQDASSGKNLRLNEAEEEMYGLADTLPISDESKKIIERRRAEFEAAKKREAEVERAESEEAERDAKREADVAGLKEDAEFAEAEERADEVERAESEEAARDKKRAEDVARFKEDAALAEAEKRADEVERGESEEAARDEKRSEDVARLKEEAEFAEAEERASEIERAEGEEATRDEKRAEDVARLKEAARETEMTERDRSERADDGKTKAETDAAAVTKEDVKEMEKTARDRAEAAESDKGSRDATPTIDSAAITKEYAEAYKKRTEAEQKEAERQKRKADRKAEREARRNRVRNAEIGFVFRDVMNNLDAGAKEVVSKTFSRSFVETALKEAGYEGDFITAAHNIVKFITGDNSKGIVKMLESDSTLRDVALTFMGAADTERSMYYAQAEGIAQKAGKGYVKPAKAADVDEEEEADILDKDIDDITDEDIGLELADTPESTVDGKAVTIEGVKSVADDGTVTYEVTDADGNVSEVSASDITFGQDDGDTARIAAVAKDLGRNAETMIKMYTNGQNVYEYATAFKQAMQYGEDGYNPDVIKGYSGMKVLTEGQLAAAYELGRGIRSERNNAMVRPNVSGIKVGQVDTSGIVMKDLTKHQKIAVHTMSRFAQAAGFNIKFVESKANAEGKYTTENGSWDPETLTLTLDVHAGSNKKADIDYAMMHTAGHELTHFIRQFADTELWNAYQDFVIGHLSTKEDGVFNIEDRIQRHIKNASMDGRSLTRDGAIEEIIADASGEALSQITEADIQALAETNPSLLNKIKQFFKQWINSIKAAVKAAYSGTEAKTAEAKMMMDVVEDMGKRWNAMFVNAAKNRAAQAKTATAAETVVSEATSVKDALKIDAETLAKIDNDEAVTADVEIKNSIRMDEQFGAEAKRINQANKYVPAEILKQALADRETIRNIFTDPKNLDLLKLPPDIEGDTFVSDSSYGGTEENTTVCIRSMAAQALMDLISQNLGRPLTVQDTLLISQEIAGLTDRPECYYCYVATDRRAYRDFLGQYLKQRNDTIEKYKAGADRQKLYDDFRGGRKNTKNMRDRFDMWIDAVDNGTALIDGNDLSSLENLFGEIDNLRSEIMAAAAEVSGIDAGKLNIVGGEVRYQKAGKRAIAITLKSLARKRPDMANRINRYSQLTDATAYAQSASWAKKMKGYAAYNGHIMGWSQKRIDDLNKHYGLRMYSFSDFSPAFILENMQMVTDAAVRGLNMLGYTKEMPFAEIFAPTGMNINISTFAYEQGDEILEDYKQGASWERAKALREKHPNVGIVMVATSDKILEWALKQDWVDVVIPYHLVRTGTEVAKYFGYRNYTDVSADGKGLTFAEKNKGKAKKDKVTSVSPVEHRNDLISYVDALQRYGLTPRFAEWLKGLDEYLAGDISPKEFRAMNPNYMKLVNETRRSYADTEPVQPRFDVEAAESAIQQMIREGGYYTPVGGSMAEQFEIAGNIADKIRNRDGQTDDGVKHSMRMADPPNTPEFKRWFGGSKVVNPDGTPKVMYHGTSNYGFTVFDTYGSRYGLMGMGSYFTDNREVAEGYTTKGRGNKPGVYSVYLSIKNPIDMDAVAGDKLAKAWEDYFSDYLATDDVITGDMTNEQILRVVENALKYEDVTMSEAAELFDGFYRDNGFDGITHIGGKRYGAKDGPNHRVYIAFEPEQIKSAETGTDMDNIGTFDPNNPDIRYSMRDTQGTVLSPQQAKYFKDSKAVDDEGNLLVLYHGTRAGTQISVFKTTEEYRKGLYLTDIPKVAEGFASKVVGRNEDGSFRYADIKHVTKSNFDDYDFETSGVYKMYANIKNPFIVYAGYAYYYNIPTPDEMRSGNYGSTVDTQEINAWAYEHGYDGVIVKNVREGGGDYPGTDVIVFDKNQVKFADNYEPTESDDIRYQRRDYSELSDRELLVQALETELTPDERDHLERYKKKVDGLGEDQSKLEALNEKIVSLRNAGYTARTSEELRAAETNAKTLRSRIDRKDAELKKIESANMIREIVRRNREEARKAAYELARKRADERQRKAVEHTREVGERRVARLKDSQMREKYRKQVLDDVKKLHTWVASPTNKGSVPEFLREPLAEFIESIDFSSARALKGGEATKRDLAFTEALDKVREAVSRLNKQYAGLEKGAEAFSGFVDLTGDYAEQFDELVRNIKETLKKGGDMTDIPFNRMTGKQLKELAQMFRVLKTSIRQMNRTLANNRYESARTMANDSIDDTNEMAARIRTNRFFELLNSTFNWKNTTPYYVFQRLGRGGKAVFEALQDGWDKMAYNSARIIDFTNGNRDEDIPPAFTAQESRAWSSEITEVKLDSGETIQMTVAQKMSLYCHTKREQSRGHLMGGGIRVSDIDGRRGTRITQAENYVLTEDDIARIVDSLTDRQREVADKLQHFMNTVCSEWGNEISMKRFGFEQMTEKNYFPIKTDGNNRGSIDESRDGSSSMFRLLNMASLKPLTPGASNAIIIEDIFNVFSDHASDMAKYNALALPILDFIKWYNYVERNDIVDADGKPTGKFTTRSTQKALERAFGQDAKSYLTAFVRDLNAEHDGGRNDGLINGIIGRAKSAAVGANLRVYGLQITSLPRAAYAINPRYLLAGAAQLNSLNPMSAIRGTEAQEKVGILKWKDLGFYSTDTARSTRDMIKRNQGMLGRLRDWSMIPAGWGDNWVSNIIYEAVRAEMRDRHADVKPGTEKYERMVNDRVREIVYKTQVVDSTMTRSDFMRSKGLASTLTAFMSEPTLTVNMLNDSIQRAVEAGRKGGNVHEILRASGGLAVRAATTFAVTSVITSLVESMFDAFRDDDEYETFMEKFFEAFKGNVTDNVNIFGMLPYVKDVLSIFQGYENSSLITQGWQQVQDFREAINSWQDGKAPIYRVVYNGMKAASSLAGVGAGNATRDAVSLYNTFFAPAWGTPKVQTSEDTESTAAKAYYAAVTEGRTDDAEYYMERMQVDELDMEKVNSKLVSLAGDGFVTGDVSESDARKWLKDAGYTKDKTETKMRDLKFKKETGVNYSEFKSAYVEGIIKKAEAERLLKKYRGYDDNKVYFTLQEWEGGEDWNKYDAFLDAVDAQRNYASEAKKLLDHGVDKSDIASAIAKAYRDAYREIHGTQAGNLMLEYLLDVYEAIGYDRDYERKYITKNWMKD